MLRIATPLIALFCLAACAGMRSPPLPDEQIAELETKILDQVIAERQKLNARAEPLRLDPDLMRAAKAHSEVMAEQQEFDQGGADDNTAIRLLAANPDFQGYVVENSAAELFTPELGIDTDVYARAFVAQWLESPAHRKNIEYGPFSRTGIGVAVKGDHIYAALLFAVLLGDRPPRTDDGDAEDP
jgi:uncharacterized protein YkwD